MEFFIVSPNETIQVFHGIAATLATALAFAAPAIATGFQIDAANKANKQAKRLAEQQKQAQQELLNRERQQRAKSEQDKAKALRQAASKVRDARGGGADGIKGSNLTLPANQQLGNFGSSGKTLIGL